MAAIGTGRRGRPLIMTIAEIEPRLCAEADIPLTLQEAIDELLARKAETRDLGLGWRDPALSEFILLKQQRAESWAVRPGPPSAGQRLKAQTVH